MWLDGVLPVIMDREEGAKEKCLSIMEDVILTKLVDTARPVQEMREMPFVWRLLNILVKEEEQDLRYVSQCIYVCLISPPLPPPSRPVACFHNYNINTVVQEVFTADVTPLVEIRKDHTLPSEDSLITHSALTVQKGNLWLKNSLDNFFLQFKTLKQLLISLQEVTVLLVQLFS